MKKVFCVCLLFLGVAKVGFAGMIVLDNQTAYPAKNAKIAIQWAGSGKEVDEGNQALITGSGLDAGKLEFLDETGKVVVTVPKKAEYFRVLVWAKGGEGPDLHTNWVDVVSDKNYVLKKEHLVPCALIMGPGC